MFLFPLLEKNKTKLPSDIDYWILSTHPVYQQYCCCYIMLGSAAHLFTFCLHPFHLRLSDPEVGSSRPAPPSAAHGGIQSYKSTFSWRESLDVSVNTDFLTPGERLKTASAPHTTKKRSLESVRRKR